MRPKSKIRIFAGLLFILTPFICSAQSQNPSLFQGEINANNINVRSDSTASSRIICAVNKGDRVEVVRESYEWYKIKLPKAAPAFIRKDLVSLIDDKTAKVIKNNVNIRLLPNESSDILGKADRNEVINILVEKSEWYQIEPLDNSFGWVHKKFVDKVVATEKKEEVKAPLDLKKPPTDENVTIEGVIKPYGKVIRRVATHKLIAADNNVFLLKGNKDTLDTLNYHKVRVTGKPIHPKNQKYVTIETIKIEALD